MYNPAGNETNEFPHTCVGVCRCRAGAAARDDFARLQFRARNCAVDFVPNVVVAVAVAARITFKYIGGVRKTTTRNARLPGAGHDGTISIKPHAHRARMCPTVRASAICVAVLVWRSCVLIVHVIWRRHGDDLWL